MGIQIPKITLNANVAEGSSFGDLNMLCVGYGLHQAWVYACMFSTMLFPGCSVMLSAGSPHGMASVMYLVSIIVFGVCLLACGLFDQHVLDTVVRRGFSAVFAGIMCAGTVVAIVPGMLFGANLAFDIVGGVLTGVGSAGLILCWGIAFSRRDGSTILVNTAAAILIAIVLYVLVLHHVPTWAAVVIVCALPVAEGALLAWRTPDPYYERGGVPIFSPLPVKRAQFVVSFGGAVTVLAFALGFLRRTAAQSLLPATTADTQIFCLLAAVVATAIVSLLGIVLTEDYSWSTFFRVLVPVVVLGVLALPLALKTGNEVTIIAVTCGYLCFEMLLWAFFSELSQRFNISPIMVFGVGRGFAALASLVGSMLLLYEDTLLESFGMDFDAIALVVLAAVAIGYCLVPNERHVEHVLVPCPLVRVASSGMLDKDSFVPAVGLPDASAAAAEGSGEGKQDGGSASGGAAKGDDKGPRRWFKENCELVSQRYMLSRRETEVLFFLAKGHNSAYIQEKLYISEGTAKTHIRHIYRKLDVHTQQDLMRMVEHPDEV